MSGINLINRTKQNPNKNFDSYDGENVRTKGCAEGNSSLLRVKIYCPMTVRTSINI